MASAMGIRMAQNRRSFSIFSNGPKWSEMNQKKFKLNGKKLK
jgi:hypothetical protein